MAILIPNAPTTMFGINIKNAYSKIDKVIYNSLKDVWECTVIYYLSKESRDAERVYEYYANTYIDFDMSAKLQSITYKQKPENLTARQWQHIVETAIFAQNGVSKIYSYDFSIANAAFKPASLAKSDIIKECYKHLMEQVETTGSSIEVDTPIEALVKMDLEKYI